MAQLLHTIRPQSIPNISSPETASSCTAQYKLALDKKDGIRFAPFRHQSVLTSVDRTCILPVRAPTLACAYKLRLLQRDVTQLTTGGNQFIVTLSKMIIPPTNQNFVLLPLC